MKLHDIELQPPVSREVDPLSPEKIAFWIDHGNKMWERLLITGRKDSESEGEFEWAEGFSIRYAEYCRDTWLPRFIKPDPQNLVRGRKDRELIEVEGGREKIYIVHNRVKDSIEEFSDLIKQKLERTESLGRGLFVVRGIEIIRTNLVKSIQNVLVEELKRPDLPMSDIEVMTDRKIREVEHGMEKLQKHIAALIDQHPDPAMKTALMNPFHVFNSNQKNPFQNYESSKKFAATQQLPVVAFMMSLSDPRHFGYMIADQALKDVGGMIGFAGLHRSLCISENFDMSNQLNRLTVFHEMVHCMHHAKQRAGDLGAYIKFYGTNERRLIINEEYDAYALELEALNLLMNDRLHLAAEQGQQVSPDEISTALECKKEQRTPATMLSMMAARYFPDGKITKGIFPEEYKELVRNICSFDGYILYEYGQPGVPKP